LEIDQEAESQAGGSEVVGALGGMLAGKAIYAFQFYQKLICDYDIRYVISYGVAFIGYWKWCLEGGGNAAEGEFFQQSSFVDFFEEAGAEGVGDFEDGGGYVFGQKVGWSGFQREFSDEFAFAGAVLAEAIISQWCANWKPCLKEGFCARSNRCTWSRINMFE
jgi:hypothetical protein